MELKPCPFCGSEPHISHYGNNIHEVSCVNEDCEVECRTCSIKSEQEAIEAWNTRANDTLETEKVVRCGECEFYSGGFCHRIVRFCGIIPTLSDNYCSHGSKVVS